MGRSRLLIIEDEAEIVSLIELTAHGAGFDTHAVGSVAEIAEAVAAFNPTALLVDLTIIGGAGAQVMRPLADSKTKAPMVIMSGSGTSEHAEDDARRLSLNAVGRLDKPFRRAELRAALERLQGLGNQLSA
ncbi:MAG TPA: response regulator [Alphaproteobacteria bacterium]|jgi:DNA-binding response OmpR family regulator|nr:response regulator [Alphaproteobacteria bacterium]